MYNDNGYNRMSIPLSNRKYYRLDEHRLNALINNSLKSVCNNFVHHINHCRFDNRVENLEVISQSNHSSLHNKGENNYFYGKKRFEISGENNWNYKNYARVVKGGKNNGKQNYVLKHKTKTIRESIFFDKLQKEANEINLKEIDNINPINEKVRSLRTNIEYVDKALENEEISNLERLSLNELKNVMQKELDGLLPQLTGAKL